MNNSAPFLFAFFPLLAIRCRPPSFHPLSRFSGWRVFGFLICSFELNEKHTPVACAG